MSCSGDASTRTLLAVARAQYGLDESQAQSTFHRSKRMAKVPEDAPPPTQQEWEALIAERRRAVLADSRLDGKTAEALDRRLALAALDHPPHTAADLAAMKDLPHRAERASAALRRQTASLAAYRGVSLDEADARIREYRQQYIKDFRKLPAAERPDPPADWVRGFTSKDRNSMAASADSATLYAYYRAQADPEAFPPPSAQRFASIDLETAGPAGKDGFVPANGSIIEVAIVEYDSQGRETDRYSQLIKPAPEVADECGTGAVEVHKITPEMVESAPSWEQVAPEIAERLNGRVLLAQNARFERSWLAHHLRDSGEKFDWDGPTVDTMTIAQQHFPSLPSHRLSSICEAVRVPYTNGHRAEHDAEVAARALFAMRARIERDWFSCPVRAAAPQPGPVERPAPSKVQRMKAGDPALAAGNDPWLTGAA